MSATSQLRSSYLAIRLRRLEGGEVAEYLFGCGEGPHAVLVFHHLPVAEAHLLLVILARDLRAAVSLLVPIADADVGLASVMVQNWK